MYIKKEKTINQLKEEFNAQFGNLKIEFFFNKHDAYQGNEEKEKIADNLHLSSLVKDIKEGQLSIYNYMTVTELEGALEQNFGLHIQVYRKSGDTWLQTTSTDEWSLEKHNEVGGRQYH